MTASFDLEKLHQPVLVVKPDHGIEAILMAAFIRYDANTFTVSVERYEDGQIKALIFLASQAE